MTRAETHQSAAGLLGGLTYFEYQRRVGREVIVPWLAHRLALEGLSVGDVGAHQGGTLEALREHGLVDGAVGFELDPEVVAESPFVSDERFRLEVADVTKLDPGGHEFDLVLLHDVLEHIPDHRRALASVRSLLRDRGHVFVSFPPYFSAFGGHQQLARGRARFVPFLHLLPAGLFFRFAVPGDNEYMTSEGSLEDMRSVRRAKLSLAAAERAFSATGLELVDRELYLVRPEYELRYGLSPRSAGVLGSIPGLRELSVAGAFYLLRRLG
jgi:SAM-dependent methyltransferase